LFKFHPKKKTLKFGDDLIFGDILFGGETPLIKKEFGLNKSSFAIRFETEETSIPSKPLMNWVCKYPITMEWLSSQHHIE
jgi:hypothetical protein